MDQTSPFDRENGVQPADILATTASGHGRMSIRRVFLDWTKPALAAAGGCLARTLRQSRELDLSRAIVVVPGARAGRRLLEILVALAEEHQGRFTPPKFVAQHELPERLYTPKRPLADVLTQQLAWVAALR